MGVGDKADFGRALITCGARPSGLPPGFCLASARRLATLVHSFASQGIAYSDVSNYLTMKTSSGSFAMTDGGANVSTTVTDRLHVGAQIYFRNIGNLGKWHPEFDWGYADYRFKDWSGVRDGKVKTIIGLHNDTQDLEFLHTFALLPESIYPLDLREAGNGTGVCTAATSRARHSIRDGGAGVWGPDSERSLKDWTNLRLPTPYSP